MQQYNFPMNYQQMQYPYYPQTQYQPQMSVKNLQSNNIPQQTQQTPVSPKFDVVQGQLAADMYQTENGQEVILLDMDNPYVYRKKRGLDGKLEPLKKFKLVEETESETKIDMTEYVKQDDIQKLIEKTVRSEVEKKLSEMTLKPSTRKKVEE